MAQLCSLDISNGYGACSQLGARVSFDLFCFGAPSAFGVIHKLMTFNQKGCTAAAMLLLQCLSVHWLQCDSFFSCTNQTPFPAWRLLLKQNRGSDISGTFRSSEYIRIVPPRRICNENRCNANLRLFSDSNQLFIARFSATELAFYVLERSAWFTCVYVI